MDMQAFFAESDIDAIDSLYSFFNQPVPLIIIALPALISLAFCPLVLFMYKPMVEFFWPASLFPSGPPNINEAISCFLAPAGLVYATSFGFSFQGAMQKQRALLNNISLEVALLDQVIILASNLNNATCKERLQIYRIIKEEAVSIILQIQGKVKYSSNDYKSDRSSGQVWKILTLLHRATTRDRRWNMDQIIMAKMLAHIMQLNTACSDRDETLQAIIHPLKWIFLECLGFFSFFGVLLLQTQSYRMELAMCIITVFSISLLCYVVADFDSPFNGFFKVNLAALIEIIDKAEDMYLLTLEGKDPYQMRAKQTICSTNPNASDDNDDVVEEDLLKV
ncbi:uncharacterized protein [Ptychodera flava]|uniref:uncharacterized protein n=1 Tax=Ptychodera flava TaxID=63121 RepID=UPI003969F145